MAVVCRVREGRGFVLRAVRWHPSLARQNALAAKRPDNSPEDRAEATPTGSEKFVRNVLADHDGTVLQSIGKGRALMHDHIRHSLDMPSSENGFRAWTDDRPPLGFKRYGCGWSGLPHYSVRAEIEVAAMIHPLGMG